MKKLKWTNVFLLALALALVACGSDSDGPGNSTSSSNSNNDYQSAGDSGSFDPENESSADNSGLQTASNLTEFRALVSQNQFVPAQQVFGNLVKSNGELQEGISVRFMYAITKTSGFSFCLGQNCVASRIIYHGHNVTRENFQVDAPFGQSLNSIRSQILSKIDSATESAACYGPGPSRCYDVRSGGVIYRIDLDYPLMANPTIINDGDKRYTLYMYQIGHY